MKTKEELNAIKNEVEAVSQKLSELSDDELKEVTAGTAFTAGTYAFSYYVHNNCGGTILNVGNPFASCVCDKCGEKHYWHYSFDYTEKYIDQE